MLTEKQLEEIQRMIGYRFRNVKLLLEACNPNLDPKGSREALGDGVLDVECGRRGLPAAEYVQNQRLKNTKLGNTLSNFFKQKKMPVPGVHNIIERIIGSIYHELQGASLSSQVMPKLFTKIFFLKEITKLDNKGQIVSGLRKMGVALCAIRINENGTWRDTIIKKLSADSVSLNHYKNQIYQAFKTCGYPAALTIVEKNIKALFMSNTSTNLRRSDNKDEKSNFLNSHTSRGCSSSSASRASSSASTTNAIKKMNARNVHKESFEDVILGVVAISGAFIALYNMYQKHENVKKNQPVKSVSSSSTLGHGIRLPQNVSNINDNRSSCSSSSSRTASTFTTTLNKNSSTLNISSLSGTNSSASDRKPLSAPLIFSSVPHIIQGDQQSPEISVRIPLNLITQSTIVDHPNLPYVGQLLTP